MIKTGRKTDFERLIKTLWRKETDYFPLIELGIHPVIKKEILGRPLLRVEDDIEFMRRMGYDFIKVQPRIDVNIEHRKMEEEKSDEYKNAPDRAWANEGEGIITDRESFEKYLWPEKNQISYENLEIAQKLIPDDMGIIGQYGDIFTMVWELMGFEQFAMAVYLDPELVRDLFEKVGSLVLSMFENMADMENIGAFWYSDDIAYATGLMMSPDFYREYFFPWLKKIGDLAKRKNIPLIYHSDGILYEVMDDIIECGVAAIHPVEPKAMDIGEVKQRYGDKLALCGGIDLDTLARGSEEQIKKLVIDTIEKIGSPVQGWCAGSSNSIPDYVPVNNFIKMAETLLNYK